MIYGISNILVYGSIFNTPRNYINKRASVEESYFTDFFIFLRDMLSCMMCTPVWVGFFAGIFIFSPTNELFQVSKFISWFFDGVLASGTTWAINSVVEWFEINRPNNQNNG